MKMLRKKELQVQMVIFLISYVATLLPGSTQAAQGKQKRVQINLKTALEICSIKLKIDLRNLKLSFYLCLMKSKKLRVA